MKTIKTIFKITLFLFITCFVCVRMYNVLSWKESVGIKNLYESKAESMDVLFIGSSHSFCSINTAILWEDYGIASKDIGDSGQRLISSYYYLQEALKTQHPKVVILELWGITTPYKALDGVYRNTLGMNWSKNYISNLDGAIDNINSGDSTNNDLNEVWKNVLFKFPIVHTRYREIEKNDYLLDSSKMRLRYGSNWTVQACNLPEYINEIGFLSDYQKETLDKFISLSKNEGFKLVLWVAPYNGGKSFFRQINAVKKYAVEKGIDYYNLIEMSAEIDFDYTTDFRKEDPGCGHLNNFGSAKVSKFFGELLTDRYKVPDRRNDPNYAEYDLMAREWNVIKEKHAMENTKNFQDFIDLAKNDLFDSAVIFYNFDQDILHPEILSWLDGLKTDVDGFYTNIRQNNLNKIWKISDQYNIFINDNNLKQSIIYRNTEIEEQDCDVLVMVVDKLDNKLINKSSFSLVDNVYKKK